MKLNHGTITIWEEGFTEDTELDVEFTHIVTEMRSGSITPTTFEARTLVEVDSGITDKIISKLEKAKVDSQGILDSLSTIEAIGKSDMRGMAENAYDGILGSASSAKTKSQLELNTHRVALLYQESRDLFEHIKTNPVTIFFEDQYAHMGTEDIVRYGINLHNSLMGGTVARYNKVISDFNAHIAESFETTKSESSAQTKKSKPLTSQPPIASLLHPLEIYTLQKAIQALFLGETKVAVIDIFTRDKAGAIDIKKIDTHSVVLFKNAANQIIVIDPNNSELSKHIADPYNSDIFSDVEIILPKEKIEIYKGKAGSRDCIDIAVKIALGLLDIESIKIDKDVALKEIPVIQEVTNQDLINKHLTFAAALDAHIRQASDSKVRQSVNKIIAVMDAQLDLYEDIYNSDVMHGVEKAYSSVLMSDKAQISRHYEEVKDELMKIIGHVVPTDI